jgi:UDP-glucose:(heptosyl)LPS alpha-1,3-glucosyltransferase
MACGLPVVTTQQCGAAELIEEGVNGFVRDVLDDAGLAEILGRLDASRARVMGEAARQRALAFGLDAMAVQLLSLYRDLLARGARR